MYNRYIDSVDCDCIPVAPPDNRPPLLEMIQGGGKKDGIMGTIRSLLGGFKLPKFELDDLLLIAIVFLLLRENGDDDLILIIAALYFFGIT